MLRIWPALLVIIIFYQLPVAQIIIGADTLYGNEWIRFDQKYFKIMVPEDGLYRISSQVLGNAGVPVSQIRGEQYQLFFNGQEIPIYTSSAAIFGGSDFIEFYGEKNRSELDRHLFKHPDAEMMNPLYSLFTDTAAYFLTWKTTGASKRIQSIPNNLTNLPPKEDYYSGELVLNYFSTFRKKQNTQGISSSDFGPTEGFSTNFANTQTFTLNPTAVYAAGGNGQLGIRYSGNNGQHKQLITLNGQELATDEFFDYEVRQLSFNIPTASLNSSMPLRFQGMLASTDQQRISNIILRYPRQFNFENRTRYFFEVAASSSVKYLEISNFNHGGTPILYDVTNQLRIVGTVESNVVKFALPPSASTRKLVLVNNASGIFHVAALTPVNFINFRERNGEFIIISNPRLYDDGSGNNWVQEYANYRSSVDAGGFESIIVDIQQLYDQFAWGLNRHPLSIRNFAHFVVRNWTNPQYVFIIGKGREYNGVRTSGQLSAPANASFYVPTFGVPGADNLLVAGSDGFTPVIPIGRIAVSTINDIRIYLNKVKQFEANKNLPQTIEDRAWMKKVLHLGGGAQPGEQSLIKTYLNNLENEIEGNKFGGDVRSFYKTSTDPIQIPQTQHLFDIINSGLSVLTFFGHSGVGTFDFSIDNPVNYNNIPRFPLMISLGCYSGNIHTSTPGVSEKFVLFDKGAIAFAATAGLGFISSLYEFSREFYRLLGNEMYGQSFGNLIKKTIQNKSKSGFGVDLIRQQLNYHGDPALTLLPAPGPDFIIDPASVSFSPARVHISVDSFQIAFDAVNLGSRSGDSLVVEISRRFPSGVEQTIRQDLILSPGFRKALTYTLPAGGRESAGLNKIFIKIDATNRIDEYPLPAAETNNELTSSNGSAGIDLFVLDNSIVPVYPPEFALIGGPDIILKASTSNPILSPRKYLFEIDTTELFNSPILRRAEIIQKGGVIQWKPGMSWEEKRVYYWRVSPDSISTQEGYNWNVSSFTYQGGAHSGWSQSHFYQFKKNEFVNMELLSHGKLDFIANFKDFRIRNAVNSVEAVDLRVNSVYYGRYWGLPEAGVYVLWMDSVFVEPNVNFPPGEGPYSYSIPHPNKWWVRTFIFDASTQQGRKELMEFLENIISPNEFVTFFTVQNNTFSDYKPQLWASDSLLLGRNLFSVLESQGAQLVRQLERKGSLPYVITYKKNGGVIDEQLAESLQDVLNSYFALPGNWDRGNISTRLIGPAKKWETLIWNAHSKSFPEADSFHVLVIGVAQNGISETVLFDKLAPGITDISSLNAIEFPFLKLKFNSKDSIYRTTAQLDSWRVLYKGVPEFAVNPAAHFSLEKDTIQQGATLKLDLAIENLSSFDGDSLLVKYTLRNSANTDVSMMRKFPPIPGYDTLISNFTLNTRNLRDIHTLFVELNSLNDQPEITRINNLLQSSFFVFTDKQNPLLDITFDGRQILDGDIVSSKPEVRIILKDENRFLMLDDTAYFKIFLEYPDSAGHQVLVSFNNPSLQFLPARSTESNKAEIIFKPIFEKDGRYSLIVQAEDATGNPSGRIDYKVTFKVITKSMISSVLNYPNPFSTSTRFLYTLTGSTAPAQYKIQIMTVSGRIVKEVTQTELGTLKPGTHLTDFVWDGTDDFGDRLAKGVYLYRFLARDENGNDWETYETGADSFVKNGVGKMVLLR